MAQTYFEQLVSDTPTRVWVNNPTVEEIGLALEQGAVGYTTNPAYGGNLLRRAPGEILPIIADCVRDADDDFGLLIWSSSAGSAHRRALPGGTRRIGRQRRVCLDPGCDGGGHRRLAHPARGS